jgi:hypothetical protein
LDKTDIRPQFGEYCARYMKFYNTVKASGKKPRTVNIDVIVLRNVRNEALEECLISSLPTEGIKPKKVVTPHRPLTQGSPLQSQPRAE